MPNSIIFAILKLLDTEGALSKLQIAEECSISIEFLEEILQTLQDHDYLDENASQISCSSFQCRSCPFAQKCEMSPISRLVLSPKGQMYLNKIKVAKLTSFN